MCWINQTQWATWVTQLIFYSPTAPRDCQKSVRVKNQVFVRSGQCEKKSHILDVCVLLPSSLKKII